MKFEWDAEKERVNIEQRGISFRLAARVFLDVAHITLIDDRQDYGETRYLTYGMVDGRLFVVAHTPREDRVRIFSARKANAREQRKFAQWSEE